MPMLDYSTDKSNEPVLGLTLAAWVQIVSVTALMAALFRFNLVRLWGKTNPINGQDPNWQHSVFVPLIGLYYLYIHRDELVQAALQPPKRERSIRILALVGLVMTGLLAGELVALGDFGFSMMLVGLLAAGLAIPALIPTATSLGSVLLFEGLIIFAFGIYPGQNDYVKDLGMVITLFGVATLLAGWAVMKVAWFPIAFLVVALPWPELVYARLAWPLQQLAASVAVGALRIFNVDAHNFGTHINMTGAKNEVRTLNVAEACAGLKSVMTFLMVAGAVAFLSSRALWEKLAITLSAIPIAIFCNVLRVTGQGILDFYWSHEVSEGFAHQFVGLIMLIPGFFLILMIGWILEKFFIEEVDRNKLASAGAAKSKRMIVEVPRRKEPEPAILAGAAVGGDGQDSVVAIAKTPAVIAPAVENRAASILPATIVVNPPASAPAIVTPSAVAKVAQTNPISAPAAKMAAPPSMLKAPAKERPAAASPTASGSTLKPSSKPAAARPTGMTQPTSTLKPSTQPLAAPRSQPAPASTLKPSTLKPSAPKPPTGSSVPPIPSGVRPPVRKPPSPPTDSSKLPKPPGESK
jgi:exosortase